MNSGDALHYSLCRTVEMEKCSEEEGDGEMQRRRRGRVGYPARFSPL